jgi:hypothetical protein
MTMHRGTRLVLLLLVFSVASQAQEPERAVEPYDTAPFLPALSPHYRAHFSKSRKLGDFPLYQLDLKVDLLLGAIEGTEGVILKNPSAAPLAEVVFRVYANSAHLVAEGGRNLTVSEAKVNGQPVKAREIDPTVLSIPLEKPLAPGERARIELSFRLVVPRLRENPASSGLDQLLSSNGGEGYGILSFGQGILSLGFAYPILAAWTGSGWDTPELSGMGDPTHFEPANYLVKLNVPKLAAVASSGVQVGEQPLGAGPEHPREVFLVAAAARHFAMQISTRYQVGTRKAGDVEIRAFAVEEQEDAAKALLDQAGAAVALFEKMFGPYPFAKLDVAQAPLINGAGGMEFPGLITVALSLYQPSAGGPMGALLGKLVEQTRTPEFVVAHEVAHQWWHALVGSDSLRHPFLDEALANYSAVMYFEARHGGAAGTQQIELELAMPYQMWRVMGGADGPVDRALSEFRNPLEYAAIVYGKGAMAFHALRRAAGKKAFLGLLRAYASEFAFRQAAPEDLARLIRKKLPGPKAESLYRRWIEGAHGDEDIGVPASGDLTGWFQILSRGGLGAVGGGVQLPQLDPATLKLFQDAVRQLSGP